jgi:hypothetical protein
LEDDGSLARRREDATFAESPRGLARRAHEQGDEFFQIQLEVSRLSGESSFFGSTSNSLRQGGGPDLLSQIEGEGWHLEHAGYVFVETGATSSNRLLPTGQGTVTQGVVLGVYLFRRVEAARATD